MFGWDGTGAIELNDFLCTDNTAAGNGGCFYVSGGGVVNAGTVMTNNEGRYGGCVCECRVLAGDECTPSTSSVS